jgi:hypothetical protein
MLGMFIIREYCVVCFEISFFNIGDKTASAKVG